MISFDARGGFPNTERFLKKASRLEISSALRAVAQKGVRALASATPVDSSLTANSWGYEIRTSAGSSTITWINSHTAAGVNVAIILQYGHGTGTGGYVAGRNYINPAIQPIFDQIADDVWKVVTSA